MMKLFWTPEALQDRDAIYDYIEVDNPRAALALDELFQRRRSVCLIIPPWVIRAVWLVPVS